jgi:hypothetical protein
MRSIRFSLELAQEFVNLRIGVQTPFELLSIKFSCIRAVLLLCRHQMQIVGLEEGLCVLVTSIYHHS